MADNLTPEQRSRLMASVRVKDTDIEVMLRSELHKRGLRFRKHVKELPGNPDVVFISSKVAVFIDGDFWHGYRFPSWQDGISEFWRAKIATNIARDKRNFRKLRAMGWKVIRVWQHEILKDLVGAADKVESAVRSEHII